MTNQNIKEKLKSLYRLQIIHSKIDKIHTIEGELPNEILSLKNEYEIIKNNINDYNTQIQILKNKIDLCLSNNNNIKSLLANYNYELNNIKNDIEFVDISKKIDNAKLDIQINNKKIKEHKVSLSEKEKYVYKCKIDYQNKYNEIIEKTNKLNNISKENYEESNSLQSISLLQENKIDKNLLKIYNKLRKNYKNGLAIVTIERESCKGCFNKIPPQKQLDIKQYKQHIICEHCGRILIDNQLATEVCNITN